MNDSVEPGGTRIGQFLRNHPRILEKAYSATHSAIDALDPVIKRIGYERVDRFISIPERLSKEAIFDCKMCGQCVLHSTGMTCPMTCPKNLRNGPCGGVRQNGNCEVVPEMRCIWVEAFERSQKMGTYGDEMMKLNPPVNQRLQGQSAWVNQLTGVDQVKPAGWVTIEEVEVVHG